VVSDYLCPADRTLVIEFYFHFTNVAHATGYFVYPLLWALDLAER
jgi:hypothetical protein